MSKPINVEAQRCINIFVELIRDLELASYLNAEQLKPLLEKLPEYTAKQQLPQELCEKLQEHHEYEFRFNQILPLIETNIFSAEPKNDSKTNKPRDQENNEEEEEEEEDMDEDEEEEEEENAQQNYKEQLNELLGSVTGTTKKLIGYLAKNPEVAKTFIKKAGEKKRSKILLEILESVKNFYEPFQAQMTTTNEEDTASKGAIKEQKDRIEKLTKFRDTLQQSLESSKKIRDEIRTKRKAEIDKLLRDIENENKSRDDKLKQMKEESEQRLEREKKNFEEKKAQLIARKDALNKDFISLRKNCKESELNARKDLVEKSYRSLNSQVNQYDEDMAEIFLKRESEKKEREAELQKLKKKEEELNKIKAMHDLLEEEEHEYKKKEEEQQKSLSMQNAAAEWIQAHWKKNLDVNDKKYKIARKKSKKAWKKKNKM